MKMKIVISLIIFTFIQCDQGENFFYDGYDIVHTDKDCKNFKEYLLKCDYDYHYNYNYKRFCACVSDAQMEKYKSIGVNESNKSSLSNVSKNTEEPLEYGVINDSLKVMSRRERIYKNLIKSGRVSEKQIGTLEQFLNAISNETKARKFHDNLLKSGKFTEKHLGDSDKFLNYIKADFE